MKTVAIVADTPRRDLSGAAALAYWLIQKYGVRPVIVGTRNEIVALVRYCPDMIVLPHVRFDRHRLWLEYARRQRTALAVLPVEGIPKSDNTIAKTVLGLEEYRPWVNLFLSWGQEVAEHCRKTQAAPQARIEVAGCPRFDLQSSVYDSAYPSRREYLLQHGLEPDRPVVTWFSCTAYANLPHTPEEFDRLMNAHSAKLVGKDLDLHALRRDDQMMHQRMIKLFSRLVRERPELNYVVKPHPAEPASAYAGLQRLSPRVRLADGTWDVAELIRYSDVQFNWRCTTSMEGWIYNVQKRTISYLPGDLETRSFIPGLVEGNECVDSYEGLRDTLGGYLEGKPVRQEVLQRRQVYLDSYLAVHEGRSGERSADLIMQFLANWPRPRRRMYNLSYTATEYLPFVLKHRRWLIEPRDAADPKYISRAVFRKYLGILDKTFSTRTAESAYVVEA